MPDVAVYAPGTPIWVDLQASDLTKAKHFYAEVFGWEPHVAPEPEAGGYTMFKLGGKTVAGLGPKMGEQPSAWTTYVSVEDANAAAEQVRKAGGKVLMEPMKVMDVGTMAIFSDPTGAVFAVWQPAKHKGAELVNQPNSLCWNELATRDTGAATTFYRHVFGWGAKVNEGPMPYTEWQVDGKSIAGMMPMQDRMPAHVPPHWLPYFAVSDCDATVTKVEKAGGRVLNPAMDIDQGRFAVLADPEGAAFAVIKLAM